MIPPAAVLSPLLAPAPAPLPELLAGIQPPARSSAAHVEGAAAGGRLRYAGLWAFAWWTAGGGRELRGPRVMFGRRGLSGREDNAKRKQ